MGWGSAFGKSNRTKRGYSAFRKKDSFDNNIVNMTAAGDHHEKDNEHLL